MASSLIGRRGSEQGALEPDASPFAGLDARRQGLARSTIELCVAAGLAAGMSTDAPDAGGAWRACGLGLVLLACSTPPAPQTPQAAPELVATADPTAGASSASSAPRPGSQAAKNGENAASEPLNDTSLELAVYRAAGVPDIGRPWAPEDYERCLKIFGQLLRGGRGDLPRQGSPRSGALFARLVDPNNFAATSHGAATPSERAHALERQLETFPGLLQIYSPANDGLDFSTEQADLGIALLELLKLALNSSRELAPQEAAWAEVYGRQKGITVGVVRGLEQMLGERERYPEPVRRRLKGELSRLAPELESHLDPDDARAVHAAAD
jgi:hypothetical protein